MARVILVTYIDITSTITSIIYISDLVWSDPEDVETWAMSPRGAGWLFGAKVTNEVRIICNFLNGVLLSCF